MYYETYYKHNENNCTNENIFLNMSECPHWLEHIHIKYKHSTELGNVGATSAFNRV